MKRTLLAAAVLGLAATGAHAQQPLPNVWHGNAMITALTEVAAGNCSFATGNINVGDSWRVQYRPSNFPGNSLTDSIMTFTGARAGFAIRVLNGRIAGSASAYQSGYSGGGVSVFGPGGGTPTGQTNLDFSNVVVVPANFTEATQYLSLSGTFTNFTNAPGCTATLQIVLVKRVYPPAS